MTFKEAIKSVFNHYANASGRASRSEYWWWVLFSAIINTIVSFFEDITEMVNDLGLPLLTILLSFAFLCPSICVAIRRCHDSGHSGWWILCPIVNIIMMFLPSQEEA